MIQKDYKGVVGIGILYSVGLLSLLC